MQKAKQDHRAPSGLEAAAFAFCDRSSGAVHFQVPATDGELPIEEAAGMLAMHCLVRGQRTADYAVLVVPRLELLGPVSGRAEQLLNAGWQAAGSSVQLSARQREVLEHVLQNLSNKEIGARLNVSERTVKFHISRLFEKFKAHDRASLKQRAVVGIVRVPAALDDIQSELPVPPRPAERKRSDGSQAARLLDFRSARQERPRSAARL